MKVFVSGCFDLLHSGHIKFLMEAAKLGDLYVSIGSDKTVKELKHRDTIYNEKERKFMLESLRCVKQVFIGSGSGVLDFIPELEQVKPDIFFVNSDGDSPAKKQFIESKGILWYASNSQNLYPNVPPFITNALSFMLIQFSMLASIAAVPEADKYIIEFSTELPSNKDRPFSDFFTISEYSSVLK